MGASLHQAPSLPVSPASERSLPCKIANACSSVAPSGPVTVYLWPSGLVKVNDDAWRVSTDHPGGSSTMGSSCQRSQGPLGSLAVSFRSGIPGHPRKFIPNGCADCGAKRRSAGNRCETLDELAIRLARGKAQGQRDRLFRIRGSRSAATIRAHDQTILCNLKNYKMLSCIVRSRPYPFSVDFGRIIPVDDLSSTVGWAPSDRLRDYRSRSPAAAEASCARRCWMRCQSSSAAVVWPCRTS